MKASVLVIGFAVVALASGFSFLWILPLSLCVGLVALLSVEVVKSTLQFRKRGFQVRGGPDHGFVFREKTPEGIREFNLPGELIEVGHSVYDRMSAEEWAIRVPDWAKERRLEIESKILEEPFHRPW